MTEIAKPKKKVTDGYVFYQKLDSNCPDAEKSGSGPGSCGGGAGQKGGKGPRSSKTKWEKVNQPTTKTGNVTVVGDKGAQSFHYKRGQEVGEGSNMKGTFQIMSDSDLQKSAREEILKHKLADDVTFFKDGTIMAESDIKDVLKSMKETGTKVTSPGQYFSNRFTGIADTITADVDKGAGKVYAHLLPYKFPKD